MTNELAIRILTGDVLGTTEQTQEAVTMAVRALSKPNVTDTNVGDTISRQAAIDAVSCGCQEFRGIFARCEKNLNALPSAERHGSWIELYENDYKCSVCGSWWTCEETPIESGMSYCPNCGSRMDFENEDD